MKAVVHALRTAAAVLSGAIKHPPRDLRRSLQALRLKLSRLGSLLDEVEQLKPENEDEADEFFDMLAITNRDLHGLRRTIQKATESLDNLESAAKVYSGQQQLDRVIEWLGWTQEALKDLPRFMQRFIERNADALENIEYEESKGRLDPERARTLRRLISELRSRTAGVDATDLLQALAETKRQAQFAYGDDAEERARPPSEKVETLYHASTNAVGLLQSGFSERVPETAGIGGSQLDKEHNPAISFTSDLYVAKEIARALKEIVDLVQGRWSAASFKQSLEDEGVWDDVVKSVTGRIGKPDLSNPQHLVELYSSYLWMARRRHFNPVFFNVSARAFKDTNPKHIGVVAASVNMTDPAILYMRGMHEYRVPPRAVVSVDKVIR